MASLLSTNQLPIQLQILISITHTACLIACYFARSTNLAPSTAYERLQHMSYIIISTDSKQKSAIPHTIQYGYTMFLLVVLQLQCEVQRHVKCMSRYVDLIVNIIRS